MTYTVKEVILLIVVGTIAFMLLSYWLIRILKVKIKGKNITLLPTTEHKGVKNHLECPYRYDIERLLSLQRNYLLKIQEIEKKKQKAVERFISQELSLALNRVLDERQENYKYFRLVFSVLKNRIITVLLPIIELNHFPSDPVKKQQFIEDKILYIISDIKTYLLSLTSEKYFEETEQFFESTMKKSLEKALEDIFKFIYKVSEDTDKVKKEEQTAYAQKALKILERKDEVKI